MRKFECVEVGNWYSEYKCSECSELITVNDDQDCRDLDALHPRSYCGVHGYFCGEQACPRC